MITKLIEKIGEKTINFFAEVGQNGCNKIAILRIVSARTYKTVCSFSGLDFFNSQGFCCSMYSLACEESFKISWAYVSYSKLFIAWLILSNTPCAKGHVAPLQRSAQFYLFLFLTNRTDTPRTTLRVALPPWKGGSP